MRITAVLLVIVALALPACAVHEPSRCAGKLEPINTPIRSQASADNNGQ